MRHILLPLLLIITSSVSPHTPHSSLLEANQSGVDVMKCTKSVRYHFFDVTGSTKEEVRQSILEKGPTDKDGKIRYAYASWKLEWDWPKSIAGGHDFEGVSVRCSADIFLPRYRPLADTSPELVKEIDEKLGEVRAHELRHVQHAVAGAFQIRDKVVDAARRGTLKNERDANRIAFSVLNRIRQFDTNYDQMTEFGKREGIWIQ